MDQTGSSTGSARHHGGGDSAWATGGRVFAAVLMIVNGVLGILAGLPGIGHDDIYRTVGDYLFKFDVSTWGWVHIILGALLVLAGISVVKGALWARTLGVVLASLVVIVNFVWMPYQPLWALVSIALGVFVIWSLCSSRAGSPRG